MAENETEEEEFRRPEKPPPEAGAAALWQWMERISDYDQISAVQEVIKNHGPLPPKPPYKPAAGNLKNALEEVAAELRSRGLEGRVVEYAGPSGQMELPF